jgi:hypothetical protein
MCTHQELGVRNTITRVVGKKLTGFGLAVLLPFNDFIRAWQESSKDCSLAVKKQWLGVGIHFYEGSKYFNQ